LDIPSSSSTDDGEIHSVLESLATRISHLELESISASSSDIRARNVIIEQLKAEGYPLINIGEGHIVQEGNVGLSIPSIVVSSPHVGSTSGSVPIISIDVKRNEDEVLTENLNLLNNPMRDQIDLWLQKHNVNLSKIVIPGNDESEYDKAVNSILSVISGKDYLNTTFDYVEYQELNYLKLAEKGLVRELDGRVTYDISKLKSAISEPKVILQSSSSNQISYDKVTSTSANPDLHYSQPISTVPIIDDVQESNVVETMLDLFS